MGINTYMPYICTVCVSIYFLSTIGIVKHNTHYGWLTLTKSPNLTEGNAPTFMRNMQGDTLLTMSREFVPTCWGARQIVHICYPPGREVATLDEEQK